MKKVTKKLIFTAAILIGILAPTVISCTPTKEDKLAGDNAANDESAVGATDGLTVDEQSASLIAPAIDQETGATQTNQ